MRQVSSALAALLLALSVVVLAPAQRALGAMEEIAVIAHPAVPVSRLDASELEVIFTLSRTAWPNGSRIHPFNHPPRTPLRTAFDRAVLRMEPLDMARFWLDRRIRGQGTSPRSVPNPNLLLRVVAKLAGSISYVSASAVVPGVKVVARVRNGKVVQP